MTSIKIECEQCKKSFDKNISEYNKSLRLNLKHFCSLSCSAKYSAVIKKEKIETAKREYYENPKKCKKCNAPIDYYSKKINEFCSHSCSAKFNNPNRSIKKICLACGEQIKNDKFCNIRCFFNHKKIETIKQIKSGKKVTNDTFKNYLIEKNGHKCQMCGTIEWGGKPILLILDHVNGNSEDCSLDNLRLICSNCDTLTPTYKGRNKGKGRFSRMKRYKEGKSF